MGAAWERVQAKESGVVSSTGRKTGKCSLCGMEGKLTKEHVPPRKAFNDATVFLQYVEMHQALASVGWRKRQRQGGNAMFVLCERCNNTTGSWYGSEYVRFARLCAEHAVPCNAHRNVALGLHGLRPLRVLKEALVIMCATCGPGLADKNPDLRRFILNKTTRGLGEGHRVLLYLRAEQGARSTGVIGTANVATGQRFVGAEFSWWPVGWILASDLRMPIEPIDVSAWARYDFDEEADLTVRLPCLPATTPQPLDFRSKEELQADSKRAAAGDQA